MVIAVDFDGTLFTNDFPDTGEPIWKTINWCKDRKNDGDTLILWTCRRGKNLKNALKACSSVGLRFDYVNTHNNMSKRIFGRAPKGCKIYADIYIDDKAVRPEDIK